LAAHQNLRAIGDRIEELLDELRGSADPRTYGRAEELLRLLAELYGAGLARIVEIVDERAPDLMDALAEDELVASLLVVHELHPDGLASRVQAALARVRPLLAGHGGDVDLLDLDEAAGAVRIRLLGSCDGCPSSAVTLRTAVERAILDAAPEIVTIDVDQSALESGGVPVDLGPKPVYTECPAEMAEA
jgi:Fe-S cluster biogenesis protein NfuA